VVLMVDEKTPLPVVVQEQFPAGAQPLRAADVRRAVAELRSAPARSMFIIDKAAPVNASNLLDDEGRKPPMRELPLVRPAVCQSF
jgi:hypothetical protein